jgi:RNA polymerase sigma-70 factor (ECF subfamily)
MVETGSNGDEDRSSELIARLAWVRALARELIRDEHRADDVAQSAAVAALTTGPRERRAWSEWLRAVVRRLAALSFRDEERRNRRERLAAARDLQPATIDAVERLALHRRVVDGVESLEEPYRSALLLRFYDGLPPRAIAAKFAVPVATVKSRLRRGLGMLRERLTERDAERRDLAHSLAPLLAWSATRATAVRVAAAACILLLSGVVIVTFTIRPPIDDSTVRARAPSSARSETAEPTADPAVAQRSTSPVAESSAGTAAALRYRPSIRGRVVDALDAPLADAKVELLRSAALRATLDDLVDLVEPETVDSTTSDAEGRFRFFVEAHRSYYLAAHTSNSTGFSGEHYGGEEVELRLERRCSLHGRVSTADGVAVPEAFVSLDPANARFSRTTKTDADGGYALPDLAPGLGLIWVRSTAGGNTLRIGVELRPGSDTVQDVVLEPGVAIRGRVTDASTRLPVAGARISWSGESGTLDSRFTIESDADGEYRLLGLPRNWQRDVVVRATGYGRVDRLVRTSAGDEIVADFVLTRGRVARGVLVDDIGAPIAGARITVAGRSTAFRGVKADCIGSKSGADGSFEMRDLRRDVNHFLVVAADGFGVRSYPFPTNESTVDVVDFGSITLDCGGAVTGSVAFQGNPAQGCTVALLGLNEDWGRFHPTVSSARIDPVRDFVAQRKTTADSNARFHFADVAPGKYEVVARFLGARAEARARVTVSPGGTVVVADLHGRSLTSIEGIVTHPQEGSLDRVMLMAVREDGAEIVQWNGALREPPRLASANADGRFCIDDLAPGTYSIDVWNADGPGFYPGSKLFAPRRLHGIEAGSTGIRIELEEATHLVLNVVEPDGSAAKDTQIRVLAPTVGPDAMVAWTWEHAIELAVPDVALTIEARRLHADPNGQLDFPTADEPADAVLQDVWAADGEVRFVLPPVRER